VAGFVPADGACTSEIFIVTREVDRNMTAQGQHFGLKSNLEMVGLCVVLLCVVASFLGGCLLGEDGIGGARYDFYLFHWPTIQRFSTTSWGTALADYSSATNPLLYMIAGLLPLHGNQKIYHVITFVVALLVWPLLSWAYHRRYSKYGVDWLWAAFGASTILISPSFRASAFWGTTDYLPFVFCVGTSLLLSRYQDSEAHEAQAIDPFTLVALAVVSVCAFYTRQYYAFLPIFAAWIVLTRTKASPLLVLSIFVVAILPEMFLVYLWKGVNPPSFRSTFHPSLINLWKLGAIIGLFSLPIIVGCIRRSSSGVLPEWWGVRSSIVAFGGLLVLIITLRATEWPEAGGGIIFKAGLSMGALGTPFVLTVSYFGLVAAIVFSMRSATNALLAGAFLGPFLVATPTFQHYLEPSLAVGVFLFADTQTARTVFNKRVLMCNFVFNAFILAIGIVYYDFLDHLLKIPSSYLVR
jgi:hypothetical protein